MRHLFAHQFQTFPRIFVQETICNVKRRTAPTFCRKNVRKRFVVNINYGSHVFSPHSCGKQALMSITHRSIGQENPILILDPLHCSFCAFRIKNRFGIHDTFFNVELIAKFDIRNKKLIMPRYAWETIDRDFTDIFKQLIVRVVALLDLEQLRRIVDKSSMCCPGSKDRIVDNIAHKFDICFDAPDPEFAKDAIHLIDGFSKGFCLNANLDQQRIEIRSDNGTSIGIPTVETNSEPAR